MTYGVAWTGRLCCAGNRAIGEVGVTEVTAKEDGDDDEEEEEKEEEEERMKETAEAREGSLILCLRTSIEDP